jgi:probable addiction module antidote protein
MGERVITLKTTRYDTVATLKTKKDITAYLNAVFEEDDPALIAHALGVVARSEGMGEIAKQAGLTRSSLYKALSEDGRPEFSTVLKVIRALGLKLKIAA